jgi:hypothetical protein
MRRTGEILPRWRVSHRGQVAALIKSIMELFDAFDAFASDNDLHYAVRWAEAGLDVAFDQHSLERYRDATESEEAFDSLIEWTEIESDRYANMDF